MLIKNVRIILFALCLVFAVTANAANVLNALFHSKNDPVGGNPKGKITVVEFFDYQCSHCANMAYTMQTIIQKNPDVRVIFKEYPIRGTSSDLASRAALAANMQGKYMTISHALLTTNQSINENTVVQIAKSKGLDVEKFKKDMNSSAVKNTITSNIRLARELGIAGTPAFFIGKTDATDTNDVAYVLGEMSQRTLQNTIEKLRG